MNNNEYFIRECINLAVKGEGNVSPNPLVGCVITKNSVIIGKGYHKKYGGPHAEIYAIQNAKRKGHSLKGSELYVNLEPCSHYGKTPPCTDAIIKEGIKRVIIGTRDPNPVVNGKGIKILKSNGIEVICGIIESECKELNKFYFKSVISHLPFVTLKIAQSLDGFIALKNNQSKWITGPESREFVQVLRRKYDAVMIGKNTAAIDNPLLNVRDNHFRNPKRIVIDRNLQLRGNLNIFKDNEIDKTFIISAVKSRKKYPGVNHIYIKDNNGKISFLKIFKELNKIGINSILVEGGSFVFSEILKRKLFDDILIFTASKIFGQGISAFGHLNTDNMRFAIKLNLTEIGIFGNDILLKLNK